jgi:hypothetical protein
MNIAILATVVLFSVVIAYSIRKDLDYPKVVKYALVVILGLFEVFFAIFHFTLWAIHIISLAFSVAYFYICEKQNDAMFIPYLIIEYFFLFVASGSILLVIVEAIFGKFF